MNETPLLNTLEALANSLTGMDVGTARTLITKFVNSNLATLIVTLTPNKVDDSLLQVLRVLFPKS